MHQPDPAAEPTPGAGRPAASALAVVGTGVVVGASLVLAWLAFRIAPDHLSSIGFAARNRQPNEVLWLVQVAVGVLCVANAALALVPRRRVAAALVLGPLALANGVLFLASW